MSTLDFIEKHKIFAVIRTENPKQALEFADGCIDGGLRLIEVTFSFPGAEEVMSELSGRDGIIVGAGTVLNLGMAEKALGAGARFLISPHTDKELITFAKNNCLTVIQGAFTSSEIVHAWKSGVDMVKIFPVSVVGGPNYVKAIKEPLPFVEIMTTGGISLDNIVDFIKAGTSAVGVSGALLGSEKKIDAQVIAENAQKFVSKLAEAELS